MSSSPELTPMFFLISSETSRIRATCQEHELKHTGAEGAGCGPDCGAGKETHWDSGADLPCCRAFGAAAASEKTVFIYLEDFNTYTGR